MLARPFTTQNLELLPMHNLEHNRRISRRVYFDVPSSVYKSAEQQTENPIQICGHCLSLTVNRDIALLFCFLPRAERARSQVERISSKSFRLRRRNGKCRLLSRPISSQCPVIWDGIDATLEATQESAIHEAVLL